MTLSTSAFGNGQSDLPGESLGPVRIEWHRRWSGEIDDAFAAMPYDHLMDPLLVRRLWDFSYGRARQQIGVARNKGGDVVGILPLKRREFKGLLSWQFLTQFAQPYARFYVLPEYTDATVAALGRYVGSNNVAFYRKPSPRGVILDPEESWVVPLAPTYEEFSRGRKGEGRIRRRAAALTVVEDRQEDVPAGLSRWKETWLARGHPETANRSDELVVAYQAMAEQGRLKTFSLYHGDALAGLYVAMTGGGRAYNLLNWSDDDSRSMYPGLFAMSLSLEWACNSGFEELDLLRTFGEYKERWAHPETRGYRFVTAGGNGRLVASLGERSRRYYAGVVRRGREWRSAGFSRPGHSNPGRSVGGVGSDAGTVEEEAR